MKEIKGVINRSERQYLLIFSALLLMMVVGAWVNRHDAMFVVVPSATLIIIWILFIGQFFRQMIREVIMVSLTLIGMLTFTFMEKNFFFAMIPYILVFVLISTFENVAVIYVTTAISFIMFAIHAFYLKTIDFSDRVSVGLVILEFLCVVCIALLQIAQIHKNKASKAALNETIEKLKEAENSKDEFLANMSHEIRTPLNTIYGMSELLIAENMEGDPLDYVMNIRTASQKLQNIVSDVLDFTEMQTDKIKVHENVYSFSSVLNDVVNMAVMQNEMKQLEIIIDCSAKVPNELIGDQDKVRRILSNLVNNAIKFTDEGYVYIGADFREESYGANLVLTVKDTGIGMTPETVEKLFSTYAQVDAGKNRQQEGMGLGLAITRRYVELLGGFMHVESEPDMGTKLVIMIPQKIHDIEPSAKLINRESMKLALYVNPDKYEENGVLPVYLRTYQNMGDSLDVGFDRCLSIEELKIGISKGYYTHVFMSIDDYYDDQTYFDDMSQSIPIIAIVDQKHQRIDNTSIYQIYKPFSVFNVAAALNGRHVERRISVRHKRINDFTAPTARILAVDDNLMNLQVAEGLIKKYKVHFYKAFSGQEALDLMEQKEFDLILMDHMMPGMDGIETFREIRKRKDSYHQNVPIVALTANAVSGAREMFLSEGFRDYISKPIDVFHLNRVLRECIPAEKIIENAEGDSLDYGNIDGMKLAVDSADNQAEKADSVETEMAVPDDKNSTDVAQDSQKVDGSLSAASDTSSATAAPDADGDELPVFSYEEGLNNCGSMEEMMTVCMDYYVEQEEEVKGNLNGAFDDKDYENYRVKVHALKSNSLQVGAMKVWNHAKELEQSLKDGITDRVVNEHAQLMAEYDEALEAVRKAIAER